MDNDTQTVTLTEFLLARIAEDEEDARAALTRADAHWANESRLGQVWTVENDEDHLIHMPALRSPLGAHIARHDPARVLAECEAKRRIVEAEPERWPAEMNGTSAHDEWKWTLQRLAVVYADHPDYDEAWRS